MVLFWYYSFRCAFIIVHSTKCFNIIYWNSAIRNQWKQIEMFSALQLISNVPSEGELCAFTTDIYKWHLKKVERRLANVKFYFFFSLCCFECHSHMCMSLTCNLFHFSKAKPHEIFTFTKMECSVLFYSIFLNSFSYVQFVSFNRVHLYKYYCGISIVYHVCTRWYHLWNGFGNT